MAEQQQKLWSARNVSTYPTHIFTNQQYLITELIVSSSFTKINTACLRATASSQPELSPMLALLIAALLLPDAPAGYLYGTFPNISQVSLLAGPECSEHGVWGQPQSPPGAHRGTMGVAVVTECSVSPVAQPQLVLLHPSTAQIGIDLTGNRVQPTHSSGGTGALHVPLLQGPQASERRYEN